MLQSTTQENIAKLFFSYISKYMYFVHVYQQEYFLFNQIPLNQTESLFLKMQNFLYGL